ncbi:MAG: DUF4178 domain-containing protein [Myxococcales bacterium]
MTEEARTLRCPACGGDVPVRLGSSRVVVCPYCRMAIGRGNLEQLGKLAELIPTGGKLRLHTRGALSGHRFELVGRVQLRWQAGVWDEWYATFDDGRRGWIAEAQGRYYLTFPIEGATLPTLSSLSPGSRVQLAGVGELVAVDFKTAELASAEGELPEGLTKTRRTVDLEGEGGVFATLDYGDGSEPPELFAGKQTSSSEQQLVHDGEAPAPPAQLAGQKLVCPACQGPIELRVPGQSKRVTCPYCRGLLDCTAGPLRFLTALERLEQEPRLPVGKKGKLLGTDYLVVGYQRRRCTVEGTDYDWEEYLLYCGPQDAFFWLVASDGHWMFVRPVSAGAITTTSVGGFDYALFEGKRYRRFSAVQATTVSVLGEFYWEVAAGESWFCEDYIQPPLGLSRERNDEEVAWSQASYVEPKAVGKAFDVHGLPGERRGVGEMQPWPHGPAARSMLRWNLAATALALALSVALGKSPAELTALKLPPTADPVAFQSGWAEIVPQAEGDGGEMDAGVVALPPAESGQPVELAGTADTPGSQSFLSQPFDVPAHQNLEVRLDAEVDNAWAWAGGAIIEKDTGESDAFDVEASYYHGNDDGAWSEGSRVATAHFSALPAGRYVARVDYEWEANRPRPAATLTIASGVSRGWRLWLLLTVLWLPLLALLGHRASFSARRWQESNVGGSGP